MTVLSGFSLFGVYWHVRTLRCRRLDHANCGKQCTVCSIFDWCYPPPQDETVTTVDKCNMNRSCSGLCIHTNTTQIWNWWALTNRLQTLCIVPENLLDEHQNYSRRLKISRDRHENLFPCLSPLLWCKLLTTRTEQYIVLRRQQPYYQVFG